MLKVLLLLLFPQIIHGQVALDDDDLPYYYSGENGGSTAAERMMMAAATYSLDSSSCKVGGCKGDVSCMADCSDAVVR
jgi:hypothetical protein